jgi:hypothetical protein
MAKQKRPAGPGMTLGNMRSHGVPRFAAVFFVALVSGFASSLSDDSDTFSFYAEPRKYDFLDCPSIADRMTKASDKERQLAQLMTRANCYIT